MNKEKSFAKELAELINRHSIEREFNDTPDYVLAGIAIDAMQQFARSSAQRDKYHEFSTADNKNGFINDIKDIDTNTLIGKYLLMAIAKITTESQTDKTPNEVIQQISKLVKDVFEKEKSCKDCPFTEICPNVKMKTQPEPENKKEYKKPEVFDVPKEVQAMAEFFGDMFPGSKVEIHRVEMPRRNPRDKRRGKDKRKPRP